jgi:hypothetical protein
MPALPHRLLVPFLVLLLSACGDSDEADADGDTPDAGGEDAGAQEDTAGPGTDADPSPPDAGRDTAEPSDTPERDAALPDTGPADGGATEPDALDDAQSDAGVPDGGAGADADRDPDSGSGESDASDDPDAGTDPEPRGLQSCAQRVESGESFTIYRYTVDELDRIVAQSSEGMGYRELQTWSFDAEGRLSRFDYAYEVSSEEDGDGAPIWVPFDRFEEVYTYTESAPSLAATIRTLVFIDGDTLTETIEGEQEAGGNRTLEQTLDASGNLVEVERWAPDWEGQWQLVFRDQPLGGPVEYEVLRSFDEAGQLVRWESIDRLRPAEGGTATISWDAEGRLLGFTWVNPGGSEIAFGERRSYADGGAERRVRLRAGGEEDGFVTWLWFHAGGGVSRALDVQVGQCTARDQRFDPDGRMLEVDQKNRTGIFGAACETAALEDAPWIFRQRWIYGAFGIAEESRDFDGDGVFESVEQRTWWDNGMLREYTALRFDAEGNEIERGTLVPEVTFDDAGRMTSWRETSGGVSYFRAWTWDDRGRPVREILEGFEGRSRYAERVAIRTFDDADRLLSERFEFRGDPEGVFDPEGDVTTHQYDARFPWPVCDRPSDDDDD